MPNTPLHHTNPEPEPGFYHLPLHHDLDTGPLEPDHEITSELVTLLRRLIITTIHNQPADLKTLTRNITALVRAAVAGQDASRAATRRSATNIHDVLQQYEEMFGPWPGPSDN